MATFTRGGGGGGVFHEGIEERRSMLGSFDDVLGSGTWVRK